MTGTITDPRFLGHDEWTAAAAEEYDRLLRLLRGLAPEQWRAATDCVGWDVHDVVAHLSGAAAGNASMREFARQARLAQRLGREGDLVDRINRVQVGERSGLAPDALLRDLEENARRGLAARRRLPAPLRALRLPFGPPLGVRPLGYLMDRIYTRDAWMHRVDLARATGTPPELTPGHDGALVEDVVAEWAAAHGAPFDLELTGPAGGRWSRGDGGEAVRLDAVEFARTLSGRAPGTGLLATGVPF